MADLCGVEIFRAAKWSISGAVQVMTGTSYVVELTDTRLIFDATFMPPTALPDQPVTYAVVSHKHLYDWGRAAGLKGVMLALSRCCPVLVHSGVVASPISRFVQTRLGKHVCEAFDVLRAEIGQHFFQDSCKLCLMSFHKAPAF